MIDDSFPPQGQVRPAYMGSNHTPGQGNMPTDPRTPRGYSEGSGYNADTKLPDVPMSTFTNPDTYKGY